MKPRVPILKFDIPNDFNFMHVGTDYFIKNVIFNLNINDVALYATFYQNLQMLICEILNNYLKYSSSKVVSIEINFFESYMDLAFKSFDRGFILRDVDSEEFFYPPFPQEMAGKEILINDNGHCFVFANIIGPNNIVFKREENEHIEEELILDDVPEHYGYILLTHICDNVTYTKKADGEDVYSMRFYYSK